MHNVSQFLPLKPAVFHILLAVADVPRHGYGIMQSVLERSKGTFQLGTSHLYRHLKRMLDDGLVQEVEPDRPDRDDSRRRYYALTDRGRSVVKAESARLQALVEESRRMGFV